MRYASLFSGIEAASVAWGPLGWEPMCFCEVEPFPCAVLEKRFPGVPNLGDVSEVDWGGFVEASGRPDVVVGGSPCQSFSVAGKREGLRGASGLMWEFVRAVREVVPRWVVWENVPGALSSSGGEDFRCLLASLDDLGYGLAWRVLDAQFFGVAQRRRRVFLVGRLGDPSGAVEVLFEPDGLSWDFGSSREKRAELAAAARGGSEIAFRWSAGGKTGFSVGHDSPCLTASEPPAVYGIAGNVEGRSEWSGGNGSGFCDPDEAGMYTLTSTDRPAVCIADDAANAAVDEELCGTLKCGGSTPSVASSASVRRLTPVECERLQGFPDDWTRIPYRGKPAEECPDGPRYKAIGNSMAVPVMRWIGERIEAVDARMRQEAEDRLERRMDMSEEPEPEEPDESWKRNPYLY